MALKSIADFFIFWINVILITWIVKGIQVSYDDLGIHRTRRLDVGWVQTIVASVAKVAGHARKEWQ